MRELDMTLEIRPGNYGIKNYSIKRMFMLLKKKNVYVRSIRNYEDHILNKLIRWETCKNLWTWSSIADKKKCEAFI